MQMDLVGTRQNTFNISCVEEENATGPNKQHVQQEPSDWLSYSRQVRKICGQHLSADWALIYDSYKYEHCDQPETGKQQT